MSDAARDIVNRISGDRRAKELREQMEAFETFDREALKKMGDKELSQWQAGFGLDMPQYRLAEHEWQSRLIRQQIKANYITASLAALFTLCGAVLGAWLTWYYSQPLGTNALAPQKNIGAVHANEKAKPAKDEQVPALPSPVPAAPNAPSQKPVNPDNHQNKEEAKAKELPVPQVK